MGLDAVASKEYGGFTGNAVVLSLPLPFLEISLSRLAAKTVTAYY